MKKFFLLLALLNFSLVLVSQEWDLIDIDFGSIDSIFDAPPEAAPSREGETTETPEAETVSVVQSLRRRGIDFDFSYVFRGIANPGWTDYYPWDNNQSGDNITWSLGFNMESSLKINARISEVFRVQSAIIFSIPEFSPQISIGDFFFDYSILDLVFIRAGKVEQGWGISPNYGFTNLLSRIPDSGPSGPSYLAKADIPFGKGGFQLLSQTRSNIAGGDFPDLDTTGFGGKINLAFQWADFNTGAFFQKSMATRAFFSVKTTLWDFEIYSEWLAVFNTHSDNAASFAFNFGFLRSFFNNKLDVNAEFFYNMEGRTYFFRPDTQYELYDSSLFLNGINAALNLLYRFDGWGSLRLFTSLLYGDNSFSIIPGIRITPFKNLEIYFALPIAFGNGYYRTEATDAWGHIKPFSILLNVTLKGDVRASFY